MLYQENLVATLPLHNTYKKLVVQCQHLEHVLIPLLACKATERTNRRVNSTRSPSRTPATPAIPTSSSLALVLTRPSPAQPTWQAREDTPALGQSMITCFNYGKPGHKSNTCTEPCKQGTIQEIDEQAQESDSTDSGKEDP